MFCFSKSIKTILKNWTLKLHAFKTSHSLGIVVLTHLYNNVVGGTLESNLSLNLLHFKLANSNPRRRIHTIESQECRLIGGLTFFCFFVSFCKIFFVSFIPFLFYRKEMNKLNNKWHRLCRFLTEVHHGYMRTSLYGNKPHDCGGLLRHV